MIRYVTVFVLSVFLGYIPIKTVTAQEVQHVHSASENHAIDGAVHPELIHDKDAYRLFFLAAVTKDDTPEEKDRQRSMLSPAKFNGKEVGAATAILSGFKSQYDKIVEEYNAAAESSVTHGTVAPDLKLLLRNIDALVLVTKANLEASISTGATSRLLAHIQREKSKMKVAVE
jgi:hypothetical protein